MRIEGTYRFEATPAEVRAALHDPAVLRRTLPGVEEVDPIDDTTYRVTITTGLAGASGTYRGHLVRVADPASDALRLQVVGTGEPGSFDADVRLRLRPDGEATVFDHEVTVALDGRLAALGQRLLLASAERAIADFLGAVAADLQRPAPAAPAAPDTTVPGEAPEVGGRSVREVIGMVAVTVAGAVAAALVGRRRRARSDATS